MYFGLNHVKIKYAYLSMQIIKYVDRTICKIKYAYLSMKKYD